MYWHCRKHAISLRPGCSPGLFHFGRELISRKPKTETYSKSRQQAEIAFGNVQTEFFAKNNAREELESVAKARDGKTLRLREARLAKEQAERVLASSTLLAKRAKAR